MIPLYPGVDPLFLKTYHFCGKKSLIEEVDLYPLFEPLEINNISRFWKELILSSYFLNSANFDFRTVQTSEDFDFRSVQTSEDFDFRSVQASVASDFQSVQTSGGFDFQFFQASAASDFQFVQTSGSFDLVFVQVFDLDSLFLQVDFAPIEHRLLDLLDP